MLVRQGVADDLSWYRAQGLVQQPVDLDSIIDYSFVDAAVRHLIPAERAYADMETLTVLCPPCFREKLRPCEECGSLIRAAAYQHLSTGRVLCEPCVVKKTAATGEKPGLA